MPAKPVPIKGKPDDLVHVQFMAPVWLKRQVVEAAAALGKSMTDFCRDALRDASDLALARAERGDRR